MVDMSYSSPEKILEKGSCTGKNLIKRLAEDARWLGVVSSPNATTKAGFKIYLCHLVITQKIDITFNF